MALRDLADRYRAAREAIISLLKGAELAGNDQPQPAQQAGPLQHDSQRKRKRKAPAAGSEEPDGARRRSSRRSAAGKQRELARETATAGHDASLDPQPSPTGGQGPRTRAAAGGHPGPSRPKVIAGADAATGGLDSDFCIEVVSGDEDDSGDGASEEEYDALEGSQEEADSEQGSEELSPSPPAKQGGRRRRSQKAPPNGRDGGGKVGQAVDPSGGAAETPHVS